LVTLRREHPGWRLLTATSAPLIVGTLYRHFIQPNRRTIAAAELVSLLDDELYRLRERLGDEAFPRAAAAYLDEWTSDEKGWLRKYYPANTDEPHYDITPATEKAIDWLVSLQERQFVGTESRLLTVRELLRQIVEGTELDPERRITELEKRKAQIESEIRRIQSGQVPLMDPTQVKERFLQMAATARGLLADFRAVEQSFRDLDRTTREFIAGWDESRGALLEAILSERDAIERSDEGKSFRAFWDFLMSPARQEELSTLLNRVFSFKEIEALNPDRRLRRIHYDWLEAGEVTQRTVARLSEQLRRYLDDQAWLENRRIMQLIRDVEHHALALRDQQPDGPFMELDEPAPKFHLAMERPLFTPPFKPRLDDRAVTTGSEDVPAGTLFNQIYVDKAELLAHIRRALQTRSQISLGTLVELRPLQHGLTELIAYLSIAGADANDTTVIDDAHTETVTWTDSDGARRQATLPLVIFNRLAAEETAQSWA
jgi:hypothetical protein